MGAGALGKVDTKLCGSCSLAVVLGRLSVSDTNKISTSHPTPYSVSTLQAWKQEQITTPTQAGLTGRCIVHM